MIPLLEISNASYEDLGDLVFLSESGAITNYGNKDDIIEMLDDPNRVVLVCRRDGRLVATTAFFVDKDEPVRVRQGDNLVMEWHRGAWTSGTITHPDQMRKGYAISLIISRFHYISFYLPEVRRFFSSITGPREDFSDAFDYLRKTRPDIKIENEDYATFTAIVRRYERGVLPKTLPFAEYKDIYGISREESKGAEICLRDCGMQEIGASMTMGPAFVKDATHGGTLVEVGVDRSLRKAEVAFASSSELAAIGSERPDKNPVMAYAKLVPTDSKERLEVSPEIYKLFRSPKKLWIEGTKLRYEGGKFTARPATRAGI